ncbi:hypothetical protein CEXT_120891 [Caerostris extrusa]|uniref:Uncharacterized protein n=1 Tax=Caerostris extrusa TaxID=172846 RepID=A0AAV4TN81_CAEEX|nr:hypothetical protein CEXT_120891 [Caerostris extrusa]
MVKGTPLRGERLLPAPGAFFLAARKTKGGSLWTPQHTPQARQRKGKLPHWGQGVRWSFLYGLSLSVNVFFLKNQSFNVLP